MAFFDVTLRVNEKNLAWYLSLVAEDRRVELRGVVPVKTDEPAPKNRYINGKRDKGISGIDLVLKTLQGCASTLPTLTKIFVAQGFAETSVSSVISRLLDEGRVRKDEAKVYHFVK